MRRSALAAVLAVLLLAPARADAVDEAAVLRKLGFPADTIAKVEAGRFVDTPLTTTTDRDLNVGIAFEVKAKDPATLVKMLEDGQIRIPDPGEIASGALTGDGDAAQLAALKLTPAQVKAFSAAKPGTALNLSNEEIASVRAAGKDPAAVEAAVHALLLARYRAYRARGLAGIAPYARNGSTASPAADLESVSRKARLNAILPPSFHDLMDGYPKHEPPGFTESFSWTQFTAQGSDTIALVHRFGATFDGTPVRVQRHYYVSTGYDVLQVVAGFLPLSDGTLVVYTNHTATDQVSGFGGSAKRGIGRKVMAGELEKLFARARSEVSR